MRAIFKPAWMAAALTVAVLGALQWRRATAIEGTSLSQLASDAVVENLQLRSAAIAALRRAGPAGLEALWTANEEAIAMMLASSKSDPRQTAASKRIREALDVVGGQRDCHTSRLFWYTDLNEAKKAASASGKPILSLRLLGKLTDEYSCANSRFFRSALYSNAEVGRALRERFILHWQSVRPVPIVTIDYGDGRRLQRTVTGNSVHYLLDSGGWPVDTLPGLYGPKTFLHRIEQAEQICLKIGSGDFNRSEVIRQFHQEQLAELESRWMQDQLLAGGAATPNRVIQPVQQDFTSCSATTPGFDLATMTMQGALPLSDPTLLEPGRDDFWARIAQVHVADGRLDEASRRVIEQQNPAAGAARQAMTKEVVERPLLRVLRGFQQSVALDTVKNEYLLHHRIHEWFVQQPLADLAAMNERVYAELFLTPNSDPWLGLLTADSYSGLENNGVVIEQAAKP